MQVLFLGTSHGVPEERQFCSGVLLRSGDRTYLIDAGAPVSALLRRYQIEHESVRGVFITHMHDDHFAGLVEFSALLTWYFKKADPEILLPEQKGIDLLDYWLDTMYGADRRPLRMRVYEPGVIFDDGCLRVTARPTQHMPHANAFVCEMEGKRLLFTGDMSGSYAEYPSLLNGEQFNLVVCEGAHHSPYSECAEIFAPTRTDRLLVTHYTPAHGEAVKAFAKRMPFPCALAYDGMTVEL